MNTETELSVKGTFKSLEIKKKGGIQKIYLNVNTTGDIVLVPIDITQDLQRIYYQTKPPTQEFKSKAGRNFKFDDKHSIIFSPDFIERLEKKISLSVGESEIELKYLPGVGWNLSDLYKPTRITDGGYKDDVVFTLPAKLVAFRRFKEGEMVPFTGIYAKFVVDVEDSFNAEGILDNNLGILSEDTTTEYEDKEVVYINVDEEFALIYKEVKAGRCDPSKFIDEKSNALRKHEIYGKLLKELIGKNIQIEYDEYSGYEIWEALIFFIDENY